MVDAHARLLACLNPSFPAKTLPELNGAPAQSC
jgi:hypothetical protein